MPPARTKQRHELKFELPPHEALLLAKRLGMLFPRDEHAGPDGRYTVRSLYFDTPFDDALREKHEGFTARAKWRMRAYGAEPLATDGAERVIRLEKKVKRNGVGSKHASPRAKPEALRYRAKAHRGSRKGGMSTASPPPRTEKPVTIRCLKSSKLPSASWGYALASS